MKKALMVIALGATLSVFSGPAFAAGKVMCASCHKVNADFVGPSLASVVSAYGSVDKVFEFLNSDAALNPKVKGFEKKAMVMKSQLKRYRALDDAAKKDIRTWFEAQL